MPRTSWLCSPPTWWAPGPIAPNSPACASTCRPGCSWRHLAASWARPYSIYTGQASFQKAIPWLLLFATFSFSAGPWFKAMLERRFNFDGTRWLWLSFTLEFLLYVYGGYFGLGMGIIIFTIYSLFSHMNLHQQNALRNITISLMTLISIVIFARAGVIRLGPAVVMMSGAILGSYFAAKIARRVDPVIVRRAILAWAVVLTAFAFWKYD